MTAIIRKIQLDFLYTLGFNITHMVFIELLHFLLNPLRF